MRVSGEAGFPNFGGLQPFVKRVSTTCRGLQIRGAILVSLDFNDVLHLQILNMQSSVAFRQAYFTPLVARPARVPLRQRRVAAQAALDTQIIISGAPSLRRVVLGLSSF